MTNQLLTTTDFTKFRTKDQDWFLDAVASTITEFCHWHIAPSVACTNVVAPVGSKGIVLLPSLHVTSVEALRLNGSVVDPAFYTVYGPGWIQFNGFTKPPRNCSVSVDFTHGYATTPKVVAEVGFELTATVLEKASGVVTDLTRGPTAMRFKEFGIVLLSRSGTAFAAVPPKAGVIVAVEDAQVVVWHRVFVKNTASTGRHGSAEEGTLLDPVERKVYQVYPAHWQRPTPDPINIEDYTNTVSNLIMDVPDPAVYSNRDQVLINGVAFLVQGRPDVDANWANGTQMFPEYDSLFGGQVLIQRVG